MSGPLTAKVLTVSDGVVAGTREDRSGRALADRLAAAGFTVTDRRVVADGVETVADALRRLATGFEGLVVTTGGTGLAARSSGAGGSGDHARIAIRQPVTCAARPSSIRIGSVAVSPAKSMGSMVARAAR